MYHWSSDRFASYTNGDIIAVADTVEAARALVLEKYREVYGDVDIHTVERDITDEPQTADEVLFIYGSD